MLEGLINSAKGFVASTATRTGTKLTICWLVFCGLLMAWMIVGVPLLSIWYPQLVTFFTNISTIITALVASCSVVFAANEARKTIENTK